MKRGELYYVSPGEYAGSEQGGGRPAIIVSNNACNATSDVVEVVYLTASPKPDLPTHVTIRSAPRVSTALCEQVTSVSKCRIGDYIGETTKNEMLQIDTALLISLDLYLPEKPSEQKAEHKDSAPEYVTALVERDVYKKLYEQLLEKLMK